MPCVILPKEAWRSRGLGVAGTVLAHLVFVLAWWMPPGPGRVPPDVPVVFVDFVEAGDPEVPNLQPPSSPLLVVDDTIEIPDLPEFVVQPITATPEGLRGSESYYGTFAKTLSRLLEYPVRSKLLGEEGSVLVRVLVNRAGKVVSVDVEKSSGFTALDDEALAVVWRAQPFPPPPRVIPGNPVTLIVPIEFHVQRQAASML